MFLSVRGLLAALTLSAPAGTALYSRLREYLLTQEQLKENGYPFPHPERPGGAIIFTAEEKKPKDREYPPSIALGRRPGWELSAVKDHSSGKGTSSCSGGTRLLAPHPLGLSACPSVFTYSLLQNLLSLWHRVPCVLLGPLRAQ